MLRGAVKVVILAVVLYWLEQMVWKYGLHLKYYKHYPGDCRRVKGLEFGSEDLQVTSDGLAFITSGIWMPTAPPPIIEYVKKNNIKGNIYLYDFKKPELGARRLTLKHSNSFNPETFHPHGMSLLDDVTKGQHLVYVVNHREDTDVVEKFRYLPKTNELIHLKSFSGEKLHVSNDLTVVEEDKFYITNYLYFKNFFLILLEQLIFPFGLGSLVYFNGTDFIFVESNVHSPNGVLLSKDKRYLYMNKAHPFAVNVYEIKDPTTLVEVQSVPVNTLADNLHLSESGDALYIGAHPIFYKIILHMCYDLSTPTPSSVLNLPLRNGKIVTEEITELFYDHGDLISGSSVAAVYNNSLLIGSIIHKLVVCDINTKK